MRVDRAARGRAGWEVFFAQHGFREWAARAAQVGLKVDATNQTGAPQLYERLGFVIDRRYEIWLKRLARRIATVSLLRWLRRAAGPRADA